MSDYRDLMSDRKAQILFWCIFRTNELVANDYPVIPFHAGATPKGVAAYDQMMAAGFKPTPEEVLITMNQLMYAPEEEYSEDE